MSVAGWDVALYAVNISTMLILLSVLSSSAKSTNPFDWNGGPLSVSIFCGVPYVANISFLSL